MQRAGAQKLDKTLSLYSRLLFPLLGLIDPETVHDRTIALLERVQKRSLGVTLLRLLAGPVPSIPVRAFGLTFPNPIGVAGGFDKDARVTAGLGHLGFGHVEVGTLTPHPQAGNPRPRIYRLTAEHALINRMGFPNQGAEAARHRLERLREKIRPVVGVSLGKQRETAIAEASRDYGAVMTVVYPFADFLTVNVSSPNTPELRSLQSRTYLDELVVTLRERNQELATRHRTAARPLLLKISPDLSPRELDEVVDVAVARGISGVVATNTTVTRRGLRHPQAFQSGGLSGPPLASRTDEIIAHIHRETEGRLPIIGVGGVQDASDMRRKLDAGAVLVQLYTGLVYGGPGIAGKILRRLAGEWR